MRRGCGGTAPHEETLATKSSSSARAPLRPPYTRLASCSRAPCTAVRPALPCALHCRAPCTAVHPALPCTLHCRACRVPSTRAHPATMHPAQGGGAERHADAGGGEGRGGAARGAAELSDQSDGGHARRPRERTRGTPERCAARAAAAPQVINGPQRSSESPAPSCRLLRGAGAGARRGGQNQGQGRLAAVLAQSLGFGPIRLEVAACG